MGVRYYSVVIFGFHKRILGAIPPRRGASAPPPRLLSCNQRLPRSRASICADEIGTTNICCSLLFGQDQTNTRQEQLQQGGGGHARSARETGTLACPEHDQTNTRFARVCYTCY